MSTSLHNTRWALVALEGVNVPNVPGPRQPHFVLDRAAHRAAGSGGCNRFTGSYETEGDVLKFGPLSATRKSCPDGQYIERGFLKALGETARYRLEGDTLELVSADGRLVAKLARTS